MKPEPLKLLTTPESRAEAIEIQRGAEGLGVLVTRECQDRLAQLAPKAAADMDALLGVLREVLSWNDADEFCRKCGEDAWGAFWDHHKECLYTKIRAILASQEPKGGE